MKHKYTVTVQRVSYEVATIEMEAVSIRGARRITENMIKAGRLPNIMAKQRREGWEFRGEEIVPTKVWRILG